MTTVIVAGALGVITISGGLFLRRLLGELTELRRQITRFDRQMRAQRARVTFLRQLIAEDGEDDDADGGTPEAAVVNGHQPFADPGPADRPQPVRRKGHLGLYLGGAVAAVAALSTAIRRVLRDHAARVTAAVTASAVTAATVTLVTVQPWTKDDDSHARSSHPTVAVSPTPAPPTEVRPPRPSTSTSPPPLPSTSPSPPSVAEPTGLAASGSPSTSATALPGILALLPRGADQVHRHGAGSVAHSLPVRSPRGRAHGQEKATPPGRRRRPAPPGHAKPTGSPKPPRRSHTPRSPVLKAQVTVPPLLGVAVCASCG